MAEHTRKGGSPHQGHPGTLGELIHEAVRRAIELAVEEELTAALGATRYTRGAARPGRDPRGLPSDRLRRDRRGRAHCLCGLDPKVGTTLKTQGSLPTEDAALVLLFRLVASGQIRLRRVDGWREIPAILRDRRRAAA